jgi:hypothetical protein
VAAHIVRLDAKPHTGFMRKQSLRILVALITLGISVSSSWLLHRLRQPRPLPVEAKPCPTPTPPPAPQCVPIPYEEDDAEYPDESDLSPSEISWFIDNHPRAKLEKLWARLHIKDGQTLYSDFSECGHCSTRLDYYDLDAEAGDEALLKVSDGLTESYRYLVFKQMNVDDWRLLGHADEWGKYKDSQSFTVLSGGRPWLVTQGQSASGSGVAYYHNRVFEVTKNRLKEVASYESEGYQSGWDSCPTREFTTRILDIQKDQDQTRVKVEFDLDYSLGTDDEKDQHLFSKRQVAVFVSSGKSGQVLDRNESTVTQRELDHIYKIDSMTEDDFLKYNPSELLQLAKRGTKPQKNWLKNFLERCDKSSEEQRLLAALAE